MKQILKAFVVITVTVLWISTVHAAPFTFGDSVNYWPNWASTNDPNDNSKPVIGAPDITGGQGDVNGKGHLTNLSINYRTINYLITAGDLFINANANVDSDWDYVLTNDQKIYSLAGVNSALNNASLYNFSDDFSWPGNYRNDHPVELDTSLSGLNQIGTYSLTNFNWNTSTPVQFTLFKNMTGGDLSLALGSEFIIGFGPTCANDVIYETVNNPVPVPTTLLLFGSGLVGLVGIRRKARS